MYIDLYQEFDEVLKEPLNKAQEDIWKNLLKKTYENKYTKLGQLLRDIENGESYLYSLCYKQSDVFTFFKNSQKIEKTLPEIRGISWEQVYIWLKNREVIKKEELSWINFLQSLNDKDWNECGQLLREIDKDESDIIGFSYNLLNGKNIFQFYTNSETKTCIPPQLSEIDLVGIGEFARSRLENRGMKNHFRSLLKVLDNADYEELSQLLRDTEEGQGELIDYEPNKKIVTDFVFSKNSEEIKVSLPQLRGVDWKEIDKWIDKKHPYFGIHKWLRDNIESANATTPISLGFPDNKYMLGTYNAFNMVKNYNKRSKSGNPMSIEEIMEDLTKSEPLIWTDKSIKEFSEFLKTGGLLPLEKVNVIENLLQQARLHPLESMNQDMLEFLKSFEQYKPLDITKESAEELLEFLRRQ